MTVAARRFSLFNVECETRLFFARNLFSNDPMMTKWIQVKEMKSKVG
jgi:hypothetical protein